MERVGVATCCPFNLGQLCLVISYLLVGVVRRNSWSISYSLGLLIFLTIPRKREFRSRMVVVHVGSISVIEGIKRKHHASNGSFQVSWTEVLRQAAFARTLGRTRVQRLATCDSAHLRRVQPTPHGGMAVTMFPSSNKTSQRIYLLQAWTAWPSCSSLQRHHAVLLLQSRRAPCRGLHGDPSACGEVTVEGETGGAEGVVC